MRKLNISVGINDFQNIRCVTKANNIPDGRKAYYLLSIEQSPS
jgi:hypothetical protein